MTEHVTVERQDRVLVIRFNRPAQLNALTQAMYGTIADGLEEAANDDALRAVVLTGNGDFFTSGNDLNDFATSAPKGKPPVIRFLEALGSAPKPVIAAVNGPAIGVGLTMLLHCDLIFASETATFRAPFVHVGVVPEAGSSLLLPQAVGMALANDIFLAGRTLTANEALSAGLISRVYSAETLLEETLATAQEVAHLAPNAIRKTKQLVRSGHDTVRRQMELELPLFAEQLQSPEFAESVAAIKEKRAPHFD